MYIALDRGVDFECRKIYVIQVGKLRKRKSLYKIIFSIDISLLTGI